MGRAVGEGDDGGGADITLAAGTQPPAAAVFVRNTLLPPALENRRLELIVPLAGFSTRLLWLSVVFSDAGVEVTLMRRSSSSAESGDGEGMPSRIPSRLGGGEQAAALVPVAVARLSPLIIALFPRDGAAF